MNTTKTTKAAGKNAAADAAQATGEAVKPAVPFLDQTSRFQGALFEAKDRKGDGPAMTGSITLGEERIGMSAFLKAPEGKQKYLSLSIGNRGGMHYYGKLFRVEATSSASGPDYSGNVKVLACDGDTDHSAEAWDAAPQLQVCGWRERNADGSARIALFFSPRAVSEAELPL